MWESYLFLAPPICEIMRWCLPPRLTNLSSKSRRLARLCGAFLLPFGGKKDATACSNSAARSMYDGWTALRLCPYIALCGYGHHGVFELLLDLQRRKKVSLCGWENFITALACLLRVCLALSGSSWAMFCKLLFSPLFYLFFFKEISWVEVHVMLCNLPVKISSFVRKNSISPWSKMVNIPPWDDGVLIWR